MFVAGVVGALSVAGSMAEGKETKGSKSVAAQPVKLLCPVEKAGKKVSKNGKKNAALLVRLKEVSTGGDINAVDENGLTPLMLAASQNNRLAVCWLVAKGADVTLKTPSGDTADKLTTDTHVRELLAACEREKIPLTQEEEKNIHFDNDFSPYDPKNPRPEKSWNEKLHMNADIRDVAQVADVLRIGIAKLDSIVRDEALIECNMTPETLAFLVRHGLDVNSPTAQGGVMPLHRIQRPEVAKLMLSLGLKTGDELAAQLLHAVYTNDVKTVQKLLKKDASLVKNVYTVNDRRKDETLYFFADSAEMVNALHKAGLDPNTPAGKRLPLRWAVFKGNGPVVKALLAAGAKTEPALLHDAHSPEVVELLLKHGCSVDEEIKTLEEEVQPVNGATRLRIMVDHMQTPLQAIVATGADDAQLIPTVVCLLKHKAKVKGKASDGKEWDVMYDLGRRNTETHQLSDDTKKALVETLKAAGADINWAWAGCTCFSIEELIAAGADVNYRLKPHGVTPLFVWRANTWIEQLVKAGADVNAVDDAGNNAMMDMVLRGKMFFDVQAKSFLKMGIDPNTRNKAGETALDICKKNMNFDRESYQLIIDLLKKNGAKE